MPLHFLSCKYMYSSKQAMHSRRQSSILAAGRIRSQLASDEEAMVSGATRKAQVAAPERAHPKRRALSNGSYASLDGQQQPAPRSPTHVDKRRRTGKKSLKDKSGLNERLFSSLRETQAYGCRFPPSRPTTRLHSTLYHRPLLLHGETGRRGRSSLLEWYDSVSEDRLMPWRKPFNPEHYGASAESREALSVRAYEVWISEIMLQQTRVAVVKDYWTRWMKKWPTMANLAAAHEDEVMGAWRGLGCRSNPGVPYTHMPPATALCRLPEGGRAGARGPWALPLSRSPCTDF